MIGILDNPLILIIVFIFIALSFLMDKLLIKKKNDNDFDEWLKLEIEHDS